MIGGLTDPVAIVGMKSTMPTQNTLGAEKQIERNWVKMGALKKENTRYLTLDFQIHGRRRALTLSTHKKGK